MKPTFFVSGAAGYLGSWIVARLLEEGYPVRGTVRQLGEMAKLQHLHNLVDKHPGQLTLFEADLLQSGSFDRAMHGCSFVIHTASPHFFTRAKNIQNDLIQPALEGTLNILEAVNRTPSVQRVVLTSSIATLYNDARDLAKTAEGTVRESGINPNRNPRHNSYAYAKKVAEKAAWQAQQQQPPPPRWDLVTIHPGTMLGPSLSRRTDGTSVNMMIRLLKGSYRFGVPKLALGLVDVRDVAEAHIRAAVLPQAKGRYIVVGEALRLIEVARLMRMRAFGLKDKRPRTEVPKYLYWLVAPFFGLQRKYIVRNAGYPVCYDNTRSRTELGLVCRSAADTVNDHINQIIADDLI